jgi:hypothetical protein
MIDQTLSTRKAAKYAGYGLLLMTLLGIFGEMMVFQKLIDLTDAGTTVNNIKANLMQFRLGICSFVLILVLDALVAWALYIYFRKIDKNISLLVAWFRLIYTVIFAAALSNYLEVQNLLTNPEYLSLLIPLQLQTSVMLALNAFRDGWAIGYIFFGLHLLCLGYLIIKTKGIPLLIGILVSIAGVGYLFDYFGKFLVPDFILEVGMITAWGELVFMFWLLIKGGKTEVIRK